MQKKSSTARFLVGFWLARYPLLCSELHAELHQQMAPSLDQVLVQCVLEMGTGCLADRKSICNMLLGSGVEVVGGR